MGNCISISAKKAQENEAIPKKVEPREVPVTSERPLQESAVKPSQQEITGKESFSSSQNQPINDAPPSDIIHKSSVKAQDSKSLVDQKVSESQNEDKPRFNKLYRLGETLGKGAFSVVRECTQKKNGMGYAVKIITKSKLTAEDDEALKDEIDILTKLKHNHIIKLYGFFDEPNFYFLILERMRGGELFDRIVSKCYYNEKEARDVCKILFEAIEYCHKHNIVHRDLKPENLLLINETDDSSIKIADFGFAKKATSPKCLKTQCGTPGYVAPEVLEGELYGTQADMWSLGVITFILLGGYPPFIEENQRELFRKIRKGIFDFHEDYWGGVSMEAKDFISSLLVTNPEKRLNARKSLEHSWIKSDDSYLMEKDLGGNLEKLKEYQLRKKFRAAVKVIIITRKLESLGQNFKDNL